MAPPTSKLKLFDQVETIVAKKLIIHVTAISLSYKNGKKEERKKPKRNKLGTLTTFMELL